MFKLRKSDLASEILRESNDYLTNGHWMARKDLLEYDYRIDPVELTEDHVKRATPSDTHLEVKRTNQILNNTWDLDRKRDLVIFEGKDSKGKEIEVHFKRRYVEIFDLQKLYGKDEKSAFTTDKETFNVVLMPVTV